MQSRDQTVTTLKETCLIREGKQTMRGKGRHPEHP